MEEIWKPIQGYEEFYLISNYGNIYSLIRKRPLKPAIYGGYKSVSLKGKMIRVHRLVAQAFVSNERPEATVVRHLDGNRLNNIASNIAWGTNTDNAQDMLRMGRHNMARKTHCPQGHEYTQANTALVQGFRHCLACRKIRNDAQPRKTTRRVRNV